MSAAALVTAVAMITVGSRVAAVAVLPPPRGVTAAVVLRLPAPLFAVLAAVSVLGPDRAIEPAMLTGIAAALLTTPARSLLLTVVGGLIGYATGAAFT